MAENPAAQAMALSDFIKVFQMGSKTGIIRIVSPREHGTIYMVDGRVTDASISPAQRAAGAGVLDGEEALRQLLGWSDVTLRLYPDAGVRRRTARISSAVARQLLEHAHGHETAPAAAAPPLTLDTTIQLAFSARSAGSGVVLSAMQWQILSQVAGGRSLHSVQQATGLETAALLQSVQDLVAAGLVEIILPVSQPVPSHVASPLVSAEQAAAIRAPEPPAVKTPVLPDNEQPAVVPVRASRGEPAMAVIPDRVGEKPVGRGLLRAIMNRIRSL